MKQYLELCKHVLDNGIEKGDRTGTGTISTFGYQMRMDLSKGFPLLTTKKTFIKGIIHELLWFLNGDTNIEYLVANNVNIWNGDAYRYFKQRNPIMAEEISEKEYIKLIKERKIDLRHANLGPVYGRQWRSWRIPKLDGFGKVEYIKTIDQISNVVDEIKSNPNSRRLIVSAWNVGDIDKMALPPCHALFQFYVADGKLSCQLYQRSADLFLGVPFNIASYALLTMMIAQQTNLGLGEFIHTFGDVHIYKNHIDQVKLQLTRSPLELPTMEINKAEDIFSYKYEDFKLCNYNSHPAIKGDVSVGN